MQSVIGALRVNLGIDTAAFSDGLRNATRSLQGAGRSMMGIGRNLSLSLTTPLAGFAALSINTAAQFEGAMNRIEAAIGASTEQLAALNAIAQDLGKSTKFSAIEAAEAIEMLAKNGLDAEQILGGALKASLDLAAASGSDLASSASAATDIMLNFGKASGDLEGVIDGVTGVLLESKFGFDDYRLALGQAGGVAGGLGVSFEDFNAAITATSSAFSSGSDAGTSFKTFLQSLVPSSDRAAKAMNDLGMDFFDANGNMKAMSAVAQELQDGLAGLSEEARSEALTTIFGRDALRTAIGLAREGAAGIRDIAAALDEASASQQAAARMEGFTGSMERLRSAIEGMQLAIANSGLLEFATKLVDGLAAVANIVSEVDPALLKFGTVVAGVALVVGPLILTLGIFAAAIGAIGIPVAAVIAGVAVLVAAFIAFADEMEPARQAILGFFSDGLASMVAFRDALEPTRQAILALGEQGLALLGQVLSDIREGFSLFAFGVVAAKDAVIQFGTEAIDWIITKFHELQGFFGDLVEQFKQIGRDVIGGLLAGMQEKWEKIKSAVTGIATSLTERIKATYGIKSPSTVFRGIGEDMMSGMALGLAGGTGQSLGIMETFRSDIGQMFSDVLTGAKSFREGLSSVLGAAGGRFLDAGIGGLVGMIPGFANGTSFAPGGLAVVGERGPELVSLPRGARVTPNGAMGGNVFNFAPVIDARGADPAAIARLELAQRAMYSDMKQTFRDGVQRSNADPRFRGVR